MKIKTVFFFLNILLKTKAQNRTILKFDLYLQNKTGEGGRSKKMEATKFYEIRCSIDRKNNNFFSPYYTGRGVCDRFQIDAKI